MLRGPLGSPLTPTRLGLILLSASRDSRCCRDRGPTQEAQWRSERKAALPTSSSPLRPDSLFKAMYRDKVAVVLVASVLHFIFDL